MKGSEKRDRVMSMTLDSEAESAAGELIDPTLTPVQAHKEVMAAIRSNNLALLRSMLKAPNVGTCRFAPSPCSSSLFLF